MANVPEYLKYNKDHQWIRVEGDTGTIGITDYAQQSLSDVLYVELPKIGEKFAAGESFGSVESVKAVSDIFMPVSGEVIEVNGSIQDKPERVNADPYGEAWMIRIRLNERSEIDNLLSAAEYEEFTGAATPG